MISKKRIFYSTLLWINIFLIICSCGSSYAFEENPVLVEADPILQEGNEYIIVLGDIQEYTGNVLYYPYFKATMDWIYSQKIHGKNIKLIMQTGDLTNSNEVFQYTVFEELTSFASQIIPYISCIGNHDYVWNNGLIDNRKATLYSTYTVFPLVTSLIEARYEEGRMENIIVRNTIRGKRYDIISLEFGPRKEVIQWALKHIKAHPEINYIVLTHEYLSPKGERIVNGSYAKTKIINSTASSPEELWNELIKNNDNIRCVLCGHNGFSTYLVSKNSKDRDVWQILFNLQYQPNGGDGLIQIWEIPPGNKPVNVKVYNTITRKLHSDNSRHFQFNL